MKRAKIEEIGLESFCSNFPFPDDVMLDILHRISFQSVLVCRRVSKHMKNLINNPNFYTLMKQPLALSLIDDKVYAYVNDKYRHIPAIGLKKVESRVKHELLSQCSNGIVCVKAANGPFILYNVFNGVKLTIKDVPLQKYSDYWFCYGFGYDRYSCDHKILVACNYGPKDWLKNDREVRNEKNGVFWVYELRNRRWESFDGFPCDGYFWFPYIDKQVGFSLNGVLYWASKVRGNLKKVIVTYDFNTRKFGEIFTNVQGFPRYL